MTTMPGNLMIIDVTSPNLAGLAGYYKPDNNMSHMAAASANYTYIDNTGASISKDIAITASSGGKNWLVLDITDPARIMTDGNSKIL